MPPYNEMYSDRNCFMSAFAKQSALWDATAVKMVENINMKTNVLNEMKK